MNRNAWPPVLLMVALALVVTWPALAQPAQPTLPADGQASGPSMAAPPAPPGGPVMGAPPGGPRMGGPMRPPPPPPGAGLQVLIAIGVLLLALEGLLIAYVALNVLKLMRARGAAAPADAPPIPEAK